MVRQEDDRRTLTYLKADLLIIEDFAGKQLPKHSGECICPAEGHPERG